jgi:hypothetical protein
MSRPGARPRKRDVQVSSRKMKAAPGAAEYLRCGALLETGPLNPPVLVRLSSLQKGSKEKPRGEKDFWGEPGAEGRKIFIRIANP